MQLILLQCNHYNTWCACTHILTNVAKLFNGNRLAFKRPIPCHSRKLHPLKFALLRLVDEYCYVILYGPFMAKSSYRPHFSKRALYLAAKTKKKKKGTVKGEGLAANGIIHFIFKFT